MQTAIAAIFIFMIVILVHEFGHFIVAKKVGIKVNEFSIGMGPKLIQKIKGETAYTLRLLPIGGYVQMEGEDEDSFDDRSLGNAPVMSRIAVMAAGAIMNFMLAILALTIVNFIVGNQTNIVKNVIPNMPADIAGIQSGDIIVSIDNKDISNWSDIILGITNSKEDSINLTIIRDKEYQDIKVETIEDNGSKIIGIQPIVKKSILYSIKNGFLQTFEIVKSIFEVFGMMFRKEIGTDALSGPVGVISEINKATEAGIVYLLFMVAMISANLGFFNLIPIPALDGSRIVFLLIELIRGKPVDPEKEGFIHFIGFAFLISLMLFITYKDIVKLFLGGN